MADQFGNLYMAISVKYYAEKYNINSKWTDYVVERLILENQRIMNEVIDNLGVERILLTHLKKKVPNTLYSQDSAMFDEIMKNKMFINEVKKNIHIDGTILEKLEKASTSVINGNLDDPMINEVIQVGEFKSF